MTQKKKTITDKELEILFGETGSVDVLGTEYKIYPFNAKQTGIVIKKIGILVPILGNHVDPTGQVTIPTPALIGILTESWDAVLEIVAMMMKVDVEYVEQLDLATVIEVVLEIIRVNRSFFGERVEAVLAKGQEVLPGLTTIAPTED